MCIEQVKGENRNFGILLSWSVKMGFFQPTWKWNAESFG
jgi:hypothetical protein